MKKLSNFMNEEGADYYIVSSDGTILLSNNNMEMGLLAAEVSVLSQWSPKQFSEEIASDDVAFIVSSIQSEKYDWYYVVVQEKAYQQLSEDRLTFIVILTAMCGVLGVAVAFVSSFKAAQPLQTVLDMLDVKNGLGNQYNYVETKAIAQKMSSILSANQMLKENLEETMQEFNNLQNTALQYQINPHFLFNTLNLVSVYAAKEFGPRHDMVVLIQKLAQLLRYSLNSDSNLVSLKEELSYVEIYLDILERRHQKSYQISWEIPQDLMRTQVLRMALQPLVENAVYHGIEPVGNGVITIGANRKENELLIWVSDDGAGMDPEDINLLNERIRQNRLQSQHIGLANVHRRLQLLFGSEYGLSISSARNRGTRVCMTLPCLDEITHE